jgi:hypothetical protein
MKYAFLWILAAAAALAGATGSAAQDIRTAWAYHAAEGTVPAVETVPGEAFAFLANGTAEIPQDKTVTLYVVTDHQFAGDLDEQIFVRWWDGYMAHWVMGTWVKNIWLSPSQPLRGLPADEAGRTMVDLWKVDIPSWVTQPGENYYAIQLKGCRGGMSEERYLLRRGAGDFSRRNALGQVWSSSEEFDGQDWSVTILP